MPFLNYATKGSPSQEKDVKNSQTENTTDVVKTGMKTYMKNYCTHRKENRQNIYRAILTETFHDEANGVRRVEVGDKSSKPKDVKVVLLIGATGSGKSTLVDAMFNHILGVTWEDDFRFKLTEELATSGQSANQTQHTTVYTIHHQDWFQIPNTLTIMDTPGLGSTEGLKRDKEIVEQIKTLLQGNNSVLTCLRACITRYERKISYPIMHLDTNHAVTLFVEVTTMMPIRQLSRCIIR